MRLSAVGKMTIPRENLPNVGNSVFVVVLKKMTVVTHSLKIMMSLPS